MNKDTANGFEFEITEENDTSEKEITRCCFRHPITGSDKVSIRIGNKEYPVVNMHAEGISFRTKEERARFPINNQMVRGTIILEDQVFDITAQVIHLSDDGELPPLCGLRFTNLSEETSAAFSAFCDVLKKRLEQANRGGIE